MEGLNMYQADVGVEAPKNRVSQTLIEGIKEFQETNPVVAGEYGRNFSKEEFSQIDALLNEIGETWSSLAVADDPAAIRKKVHEYVLEKDRALRIPIKNAIRKLL